MSRSICHLALPAAWEEAQRSGRVEATVPTEGFVHCSTPAQLVGTIERHFDGVDELSVLILDPDELGPDLRWEESRPGEVYPHLYRPIEVAEVQRVVTWQRSPGGGVDLPAELSDLSERAGRRAPSSRPPRSGRSPHTPPTARAPRRPGPRGGR